MNPELLALLQRIGSTENPLSDDELADLSSQIVDIVSEIDAATATDDDLIVLQEAAQAATSIRAEQEARATAQAERQERAAALLAEVVPPAAEDPDPAAGDEGDGDAAEGADGTTPEVPATDPAPEGDAADGADAQIPEPIAAAAAPAPAAPAPQLPSISRLAHRARPERKAAPLVAAGRPVLTAAADVPGLAAGAQVDPEEFARGIVRKFEAVRKVTNGGADGEKLYLGSVHVEYPDERILDLDEFGNEAKINAVAGKQALVASGGICSPVAASYDVMSIGSADRPVRDGLAQFAATRGGLRYILPHTLAQVTADAPASVWTAANDVALNNPSTKPHATFSCQSVQEAFVDAVTSIVQFGNFQARYFPEQIAQYMETVDSVHARLAEATLLAAITTGSTAVNSGVNLLGAASEVLAEIDRAVAAYRYRHRMAMDSPLRVVYPEWLEDMIRADLAREQPGNSGGQSERLAVADAEIDRFFAVRNLNVSKVLDSPTGASPTQGWGVQGAGDLLPWPSKVIIWIYHEGAWMFLDGGELNLGMVRDSTLNRTNDFQMFSETFEKAIFRGHESIALTLDTCVSGQRANTVDTSSLCTSGS